MKKILFAAFAASLLAASCQKTEVIGTTTNGPEMTFSTEMKKITKVGTSDADAQGKDDNLQAQGFNIWAYADYDLTNATNVTADGIYDGMNGWFVDYQNSSWNPNKKYYWPGTGKDLRFFAVSLETKENTPGVTSSRKPIYTVTVEDPGIGQKRADDRDDTAPKIKIEDFQVDNTAPNEDLMVADFVKQNQSNKKVTLNFHHTLSKVQFLFKTTADVVKDENGETTSTTIADVTVKLIAVEDLESKGTLTVTDKTMNGVLEDEDFQWDYGKAYLPFGKTDDLKLTEIPTKYDTWLMIPQSISGKKIKIQYQIDDREFEAIFNLNADIQDFAQWARNQYIKYTIDISPNKIKFNATSSDWDPKTDVDMNN